MSNVEKAFLDKIDFKTHSTNISLLIISQNLDYSHLSDFLVQARKLGKSIEGKFFI